MAEEDEFSLGGDDFSLGDTGKKETTNKASTVKSTETVPTATSSDDGKRINIDKFYDLMVADWRKSKSSKYDVYLQQGNIPSGTIYSVLGLEPFAKLTEEDIKRIENWKAAWTKEGEKYQRTDLEKSQDITDAVGSLCSNFLNTKKNEIFVETLKKATWAHLDTVIADKCSDGIVELYEMADILKIAKKFGLLTSALKTETMRSIHVKINAHKGKIETIEEAFKAYVKEYVSQNPANIVDNSRNRENLLKKYTELKTIEYEINEKSTANIAKDCNKTFYDFLKTCCVELRAPLEYFENEYFAQFKKTHDLSKPLSSDDYSMLKASAISTFGVTETKWMDFEKNNNIKVDRGVTKADLDNIAAQSNAKQQEINDLQAKIAKLESQQASQQVNPDEMKQLVAQLQKERNALDAARAAVPTISPKSRLAAMLLCLFLGAIGAHRFYVGKIKTAILFLILFYGVGFATGGIVSGLMAIWVIIDFFKICGGKFKDKNNLPLKKW